MPSEIDNKRIISFNKPKIKLMNSPTFKCSNDKVMTELFISSSSGGEGSKKNDAERQIASIACNSADSP